MKETTESLSCVLIPMTGRQLLLPNVSIAEVVDYGQSEKQVDGPEWLMGYLDWRGLKLPIISYDAANGNKSDEGDSDRGRIVVLNTIGENHQAVPFMALMTQGIPSQARLTAEQVTRVEGDVGTADLMQVEVAGETAYIPDLGFLETLASKATQH